jgi:two-component system, NarL family, sensor histidine kinase DesK
MNRDAPSVVAQEADDDRQVARARWLIVRVAIAFILIQPAFHLLTAGPRDALQWFQLTGAVVLAGLVIWRLSTTTLTDRLMTGWELALILSLALALFVTGGVSWLGTIAVAAAACGRFSRSPWPAVAGATACVIAGVVLIVVHHYPSGNIFSVLVIAPLAALFAYSASRRADTLDMLRRTRAELARAAAAEERLRIARDLHDLLGHSLSLITLKAELAGRVLGADPDRAAREIAELESVARQSLSDVREAVAGFRQPDLAGELVAARQLLDAAGIASQIAAPDTSALPQPVDAALAWAVREGTTNVVRHSRATKVSIRVSTGPDAASAEVSDNGPAVPAETGRLGGPTAPVPATGPHGLAALGRVLPPFAGSGLAGLAERIRGLGGELAAGNLEPQGFLLRVVVPLSQ